MNLLIWKVFTHSMLLGLGFLISLGSMAQPLEFIENADQIKLYDGGRHIFSFQKTTISQNGDFFRANYIHPLNDFQGSMLTEDFPPDHPHHRGVFWAWHQLYLDGESVADLWECRNVIWKVKDVHHQVWNDRATMSASVDWIIGENNRKVLNEKVSLTYHHAQGFYTLDFEINLRSQSDGLELGGSVDEKGYGGFSPRLNLSDQVDFFGAHGKVVPQNDMVQAGNWVAIRGIGVNNVTLAIMYHPLSSASLQGWILRSKGSMQNAAWPGRERVVMNKGDKEDMKVRMVVFEESATQEVVQQIFEEYVQH